MFGMAVETREDRGRGPPKQIDVMKTGFFQLLTVCGAFAGVLPVASRAADDKVPVVTNQEAPQAPAPAEQNVDTKSPQLSAGLADILKLKKSGIEESIILSYVKCSEVAYQPTADELIKLREAGVSAPVIDALLHRGDELRQKAAEARKAQTQLQVTSPPEPVPVQNTNVSPSMVYTPDTSYAYYPYWPYYGCGTCGYPCYYYGGCYPSFTIGFGFGFGYGWYPYGCYGSYGYYGCYPYYCGSYYYGGCHGGSYHVGPYGAYNGAKSGYVSTSAKVSKSGGVNRGGYQTGYSGARKSAYQGGSYAPSSGGYADGYKGGGSGGSYSGPSGGKSGYTGGGSYGGYRGGSPSAASRGGFQSGYSGGARGGGFSGGGRGK